MENLYFVIYISVSFALGALCMYCAMRNRNTNRPTIVCLCGSTRFFKEFMLANYQETMAGKIVLSVGFYAHASEEAHNQNVSITEKQKIELDELHKRKIDLADEIYVININGYIGSSTRSEIDYAIAHRKKVRYLEPLQNLIPETNISENGSIRLMAALAAQEIRDVLDGKGDVELAKKSLQLLLEIIAGAVPNEPTSLRG